MTTNLMEQYIKNTEGFINDFTKAFFADNFNEKISKEYISTYIDARIYNFGDEEQKFFYKRITESLNNKTEELLEENKKLDAKLLNEYVKMYDFIYYIDDVRTLDDIREFISLLYERRNEKFKFTAPIRGLENRLFKMSKDYRTKKEQLMRDINTDDFELRIEKYILVDNTYKVNIDYKFKIPYIYSNKVIEEVYNDGVINEDKLIIEYTMLTPMCIRDINEGNFAKKYIVDFANSLFKKSKKLNQTLRVINNLAIQDKVILKITYTDFDSNKELIYGLMQDGYRFAIILTDDFNATLANIKKLEVFKYLIVPENGKSYDLVHANHTKINNEIIYD